MIKERTSATIQPLSKSQLLPDGWTSQEVDTFFNALNQHEMQVPCTRVRAHEHTHTHTHTHTHIT